TNAASFSFVPGRPGEYEVSVLITDNDGASSTATHTITVNNVSPTVALDSVPSAGQEGTAITVNSIVSDPGDGSSLTYGWTVYRNSELFALPVQTVTNGQSFTFTPTD